MAWIARGRARGICPGWRCFVRLPGVAAPCGSGYIGATQGRESPHRGRWSISQCSTDKLLQSAPRPRLAGCGNDQTQGKTRSLRGQSRCGARFRQQPTRKRRDNHRGLGQIQPLGEPAWTALRCVTSRAGGPSPYFALSARSLPLAVPRQTSPTSTSPFAASNAPAFFRRAMGRQI